MDPAPWNRTLFLMDVSSLSPLQLYAGGGTVMNSQGVEIGDYSVYIINGNFPEISLLNTPQCPPIDTDPLFDPLPEDSTPEIEIEAHNMYFHRISYEFSHI